ncbi:helix-turn-helix transcriptional regulator [Thermogemmatispora sp.]|uniref:helix-turn-helix transcriptional regulator n=1 Tax=Thermogemmatispora sp. TaxID=1968838 RepID=UPI0035E44E0F
MERVQGPPSGGQEQIQIRSKERVALIAARRAQMLTLEEVAERVGVSKATVYRWEKEGDVPQPLHLRKLCELFGKSAVELGFQELEVRVEREPVDGTDCEPSGQGSEVLEGVRRECLPLRVLGLVWRWPAGEACYEQLQERLRAELEREAMNHQDEVSRREALRMLALAPIELLGLSQLGPVLKGPALTEDILKQCAAGLTACWQLRWQGELTLADQTVAAYLPTLVALTKTGAPRQRKEAAALAAQGWLLRSWNAVHLSTPAQGVIYAQQAEVFSVLANHLPLRIVALGNQAVESFYHHRYSQALQIMQKARHLLKERDRQKDASVAQPASEPVPSLIVSSCLGRLAMNLAAASGQKEEVQQSLKRAQEAFFSQSEPAPPWVTFRLGDLLLDEAYAFRDLGLSKDALKACDQIEEHYQRGAVTLLDRTEAQLLAVLIEASRDDQPRRLEWCLEKWQAGVAGAYQLQSQQWLAIAQQAYIALCAAFPGEKRLRELRELLIR